MAEADAKAIDLAGVHFARRGRSPFEIEIGGLTVERGERVFLHGPSGSGKSTLLNLICGLAAPDQGSVTIDGTDITRLSAGARDRFRGETIGVIFQMFNLLPYATPLQNILLTLAFSRSRAARVGGDTTLAALRLTRYLSLPDDLVTHSIAANLSIGQQQRVAIARALIGAPPVVIADEPTSALDTDAQLAFIDLLFEQVGALGLSLLMVSHDQRLAQRFDRTIAIADIARTRRGDRS